MDRGTTMIQDTCNNCGGSLKKVYRQAPSFNFKGGESGGILSSPLLRTEILRDEGSSNGIGVLDSEDRKEIAKTLLSKGDSPALAKEVRTLREKRLKDSKPNKTLREIKASKNS